MPQIEANGVRLYYEEQGRGAPILGIHGTGSSAMLWSEAVPVLATLGRVIVYDRRGCTRSERPRPFSAGVGTHVDDAAALLGALSAGPAIVIGRSYGGAVAIQLALRHPGASARSSCWKRSSDPSFPRRRHGRPSWRGGWKRSRPPRTTPSRRS